MLFRIGTVDGDIRERTVQERTTVGEFGSVIMGRSVSMEKKRDSRNKNNITNTNAWE